MALPKINDLPSYELIIPSTKQKMKYRPFLVKEQKILMMALETENEEQILNAIMDTIKSCATEDINPYNLTSFDVEYIFTQIRAKSVGESAKVRLKCSSCKDFTDVSIPLDDIKVDMSDVNQKIVLNDQFTLLMKFPTFEAIAHDPTTASSATLTGSILRLVHMCLDKLQTEDELISFADETQEEIDQFLESLDPAQFEKLIQYVTNLPKLTHDVKFKCSGCGVDNNITLRGIQDFF